MIVVMDSLYRELIIEHWQHPQNSGKVRNPTFQLTHENKYCGDAILVSGKVKKDKLTDVKFIGEGCSVSIASASMFTEHIKGMAVKSILAISQKEFLELLGIQLGTMRLKCALFVYEAINKALTNVSLQSHNISV